MGKRADNETRSRGIEEPKCYARRLRILLASALPLLLSSAPPFFRSSFLPFFRSSVLSLILSFSLSLFLLPPASAQISRIEHPDTTAGNFFGVAVSVSGDRALVGASSENTCGENSGAAYLFAWDAGTQTWREDGRLVPEDCAEGRFFGRSVALSGDRALISSSQNFFATETSSAAYVFERDALSGAWKQVARLTADPAMNEGAFGTSVSLDGDRALVTTSGDPTGGRYHGAAYIFERDPKTGEWSRTARLVGSDGRAKGIFGGRGDLDGDRIAVAASTYSRNLPGSVYIFERDPDTGGWKQVERIPEIDDYFISLDLDGNRLLIGESRSGRRESGVATLYERRAPGVWEHTATLHPKAPYENGAFGTQVSLSGDRALIVGYDEQLGYNFNIDRVVYAYSYDPTTGDWRQDRVYDIGEVAFGFDVDHNEHWVFIGEASQQKPGAAYVVKLR